MFERACREACQGGWYRGAEEVSSLRRKTDEGAPHAEDAVQAAAERTARPAVARVAGARALARDARSSTGRWRRPTDGPSWVFYEGPPTANGMPGAHHVEARVFKDLFPRFKTMKGYHVPRKAGWDCHGLPVELAVEKELGFTGKQDIEAYGVAEFNAKCRESVLRHVDAVRAAHRADGLLGRPRRRLPDHGPRATSSRSGGRSRQIWDKGLLVQDHRISPYCPRCGTALSDPEVAQGYTDRRRPGASTSGSRCTCEARAPIGPTCWSGRPRRGRWSSNTAVAVHPDVDLRGRRSARRGGRCCGRRPLFARVLGDGLARRRQASPGKRWRARVPAPVRPDRGFPTRIDRARRVFVTVEDGTGPGAPGAGVRRRRHEVASARTACPWSTRSGRTARSQADVPLVGGMFFKDADQRLVDDLDDRGLLFRHERYEHSYPHCWRCGTPLLYYAVPSWYIRTTAIKDRLLAENERTNWYPATDQVRPVRRVAAQQRRLGAVPEPVLGHAAAAVGVRRRVRT